ncbi:GGDEF domain-containing protein [Clostridium estertheticum]|uniref:sensor domain-containing diguanylate cyclase n=1 Tax=Clostridium estertheticum TaxID=238834 RepID=UPI001CF298BF|nr:GGDEF domain-containing protein [Clostridium estertheticum]MCB2308544.1 GGDEF domain-containing protein [Clostridium estertheticum]MCB2346952.1 GGDEF domain-containing protein [Clostridium estertheticum]MCB2351500.1 GGDEF domain-containing protein [Clostridium estertheticum]WAG46583.1 GGDEF domain-containing protein [Clostridium estertheticum]
MNDGYIRREIKVLLEKANSLKNSDSQGTIEFSNDALLLSEKIGYTLGEKVANLYMAYSYYSIGNNEKALELIFVSLHYFIKEGFCDLIWWEYNLLGIIFSELGDIEKSMSFYDKAQIVAIEIDLGKRYDNKATSKGSIMLTLNNIAENYKLLNEYKEALSYSERAYDIDSLADYSLSSGVTILSLGEIYYLLEEYEKANILSYKALKYMKRYNYTIADADIYKLLAQTSWKKRDYAKADEYFYIAINLNEKEAIPSYKIDALLSYYEYMMDRKKIKKAIDILINACNVSIKYKQYEKVSEISMMLSILYEKSGEYESSFRYMKLHYKCEKKHTEDYKKNIIQSLNMKKKMLEIEKENNRIIEKNENLKIESQSLQMLVEKISIISELGQKITSTLNEHSILDILYSSIKDFMDLSYFCIGLYDENNSMINYLDAIIFGKKKNIPALLISNNPSFTKKCIDSGELIIINDVSKEFPRYINEGAFNNQLKLNYNSELNSLMFCPLIVNAKIIGVMSIQSKGKNAFTPYHIEMVKALSSYAAIAINNSIKSMELEMEVIKTKGIQIELEKVNKILLSLSENDSLTGIPNRRKFDIYINDVWESSIREGSSLSLLVIDIDYFKEYNDNFGHLEGDNCLARVASILAKLDNGPYFVARFGGDEFVILLPESSIDYAIKFGENLRSELKTLNIRHKFSEISDRITLSIGISSVFPNENITINQFIRKVDNELYIAKRNGRNRISADVY